MNKMQPEECAKEIYSINWPCKQEQPIKITLKQMEAILTAAEIVRKHVEVHCVECKYLDTVECPGSHNLTAVQKSQLNSKTGIFTARGLKFCGAGERKDGEEMTKCCETCEYWFKKEFDCEHPEQIKPLSKDGEATPDQYCNLWEAGDTNA